MRCRICYEKVTQRDSKGMFKSTCEKESCQIKNRSEIGHLAQPIHRGDADTGLRN